ncbi:hypothetical protein PQX77_004420 [Marasmius sp. AFHP31]|nr:hypothetical protein PQX77_004420 [Marasmius sp. AFHP31]
MSDPSEAASKAGKFCGTHGGRRLGSGRKRKAVELSTEQIPPATPPSSSSQIHSSSRLPQPSVPLFFTSRRPQGVTQPLAPNAALSGGSSTSSTSFNAPLGDGVCTRQQLNELVTEINMIIENDEYTDIRREVGREIDESVTDNLEDSMEENAKVAKRETEESEAVERLVTHQYLLNLRTKIQQQVKKHGKPQCYSDGQFFIHPPHPVFALHDAAVTSFSPDALCLRPVFVWLPSCLPGAPDHFKCQCGGRLTLNGYLDNPIARRVRTSTGTDYLLLTNRYICDPRRESQTGCGVNYQGSDPHILSQLPRHVQEAFPAYLSTRGALDRSVMDQMKACFATRFGPEPFSKLLLELQMLEHSRRELMYLAAARFYGLSGSLVPPFPSFKDPATYAGAVTSTQYLKCLWTDYQSSIKIYADRIQASLTGFKLSGDHTFKVTKSMARLNSEPVFGALFSLVNEWEEIRAQSLTLTKGFSILPEMFKQVSAGLKEHGHQPTSIYYCDNPPAEREFHERVTESLKKDVRHVPPQTVYSETSPFKLSSPFEFYESFMLINNACDEVLEVLETLRPTETLAVAISVSYGGQHTHQTLQGLQIRMRNKIFVLNVSELSSLDTIPISLRSLLTNPRIVKVGHDLRQSMTAVANSFNMNGFVTLLNAPNSAFIDLGQLAKVKGVIQDPYMTFDALAKAVLHKHLPSKTSSTPSWSSVVASEPHWSRDAALEVDIVWHAYLALLRCKSVGLPLTPSTVQSGQLVTLVSSRKEVAEGIVLDHNGAVEVVMKEKEGALLNRSTIKITPAYSLIQITRVLVPGALISKQNHTVEFIFEHGGKAVVQTKTLRSRPVVAPLPRDPQSTATLGIPAPSTSALSECVPLVDIGPSQCLQERATADNSTEDIDDDIITQDEDEDGDLEETLPGADDEDSIGVDYIDEYPEPEPEEIIINALRTAKELLSQEGPGSVELASRVLDDAFHFMDRLLKTLPKKHTAFKEFAHQFSETIFVRDTEDLKAVKAVIEKKGLTWDYLVRAKKPWLNRHIRRYIPPPERLGADLKQLFNSFKNIVGHFNRTGKKWASHYDIWILDEITEVATELDTQPSFQPPPILATRIATSEAFGIIPIPPSLAAEYNISMIPARRIEGLPHHRDIPIHMLSRLSTKPTSPYRYLQLTQRAIFPVLPIHTHAERKEFKRLLGLFLMSSGSRTQSASQPWKGVNWIQFTKTWNLKVDAQDPTTTNPDQRLYYKLPELLLRHHKKVFEWQASRATLQLGSNVLMVQNHMEMLDDSERVSHVLPAVPLKDSQVDPTTNGVRGLDLTLFNPMAVQSQPDGDVAGSGCTLPDLSGVIEYTVQSDIQSGSGSQSEPSSGIAIDPSHASNPAEFNGLQLAGPMNDVEVPQEDRLPVQAATFQSILSFSSPGEPASERTFKKQCSTSMSVPLPSQKKSSGRKNCAVCKYYKCPKAQTCPGSGGRQRCYESVACSHPRIPDGKVR